MRLLRFFGPENNPAINPALAVLGLENSPHLPHKLSRLGIVAPCNEGIIDVQRYAQRDQYGQLIETFTQALHPEVVDTMRDLAQFDADLDLNETIRLAAPIDVGSKLLCVGANYHKKYPLGGDVQAPPQPVYFNKPPGILAAHGEPLAVPAASEQLDYEAEIAVVIGKPGRHIDPLQASEHVAGYTILNDGSVRNWQRHSVAAGKNFYMTGAIGPYIITADEVEDPSSMRISSYVNGEQRQSAGIDEMIFTVAELVSYLSRIVPLAPGDVISTGSPEGTGGSHDPPMWLKPGDLVTCELTGMLPLTNPVTSEQALTRPADLERDYEIASRTGNLGTLVYHPKGDA